MSTDLNHLDAPRDTTPATAPATATAAVPGRDGEQGPGSFSFTERQWEVAGLFVAGMPRDQVGRRSSAHMNRALDVLQARLGVLTVRAMCFRLLELGLLPVPGPYADPELDPAARAVWEGLRWDVLDADLVPTLVTRLGLSTGAVNGTLDQLTQRYRTTRHGLIRYGFAHGVLTGGQSVTPPVITTAAASPPGSGTWECTPAQRRALALRASGRDVAACAMADETTQSTITGRLTTCRSLAGVHNQRALTHRAVSAQVLVRPAHHSDTEIPDEERAVWECLPLDVPDAALPSAISGQTGLSLGTVQRCMRNLRIRYGDDCAAVYAGWRHGVLDEHTPTEPARGRPLPGARDSLTLSTRQLEIMSCRTVGGRTAEAAAHHLGIRLSTVLSHERSGLLRAEVETLRAWTQRALAEGLIVPLDPGDRDPGPLPDMPGSTTGTGTGVTVWRHLPLDVPDNHLAVEIAAMASLSLKAVQDTLDTLRATGLTDPQLIAVGWHRQLLDARTPIAPAAPASRAGHPARTTRRLITPAVPATGPRIRPAAHRFDPLGLLPHPPQAPALGRTAPDWGPRALAGQKLDFLRVGAQTARDVLARVPESRWGPVIGLPEVGEALLVTAAKPRTTLRGSGAGIRILRANAPVDLPGPATTTGPNRYWAVPPTAPLWPEQYLDWLLTGGPMPGLTGGSR
ncbi:hypothetical protein [Streptomyces anulatus]|uniref:hypothetical protein n=1 Tax=Streptomyces anulatus TaxID=1892 RepID=UPI001C2724D9|nr:hypothetical protein [Streptomyces anulatus]